MTEEIKPPIGIEPRGLYETLKNQERVTDILEAIDRYYRAGTPIPNDWLVELNELGALENK